MSRGVRVWPDCSLGPNLEGPEGILGSGRQAGLGGCPSDRSGDLSWGPGPGSL